jgi:hypothetical protein
MSSRRGIALIAAAALIGILLALVPPIHQDPVYHLFADRRTIAGVPNFWNVVSNVPFLIVAILGLRALRSRTAFLENWERVVYGVLLAATLLVGIGSAYYHLRPDDQRLFWDRLPMSVLFPTLVVITIGERIGSSVGKRLFAPLLAVGVVSVLVWRWSGDLRLYAIVQFGSMVAVPFLLLKFPPRYSSSNAVWGTVALYGLAKIAELLDSPLGKFAATGGHPWKHLAAAAAMLVYVNGMARRHPLRAASGKEASL